MIRSMAGCAAALAAILGVSACSAPSTPPAQAADAKTAAAADTGCKVQGHHGVYRFGSTVPLFMKVQNTGRWCFSSFGFSGVNAEGSRIVDRPAHGELRLLTATVGIRFGYRPAAGYTGSDSFLISMPGGVGLDMDIAVTVHVTPAAPAPAA